MKKLLACLVVFALSVTVLAFSASAAEATFVDTLEDNYPLVYEKSEWMRYEYNKDTDKSLYEKVSESKVVTNEEYVVYKLPGYVTGFAIDCMHVNGLGNGSTDISVYLSNDDTNWVAAKTSVSEQTYDDEIYINKDTAYWLLSTVSDDGQCPAGYQYIKITINAFTVKDSCVWNTVMDTITVKYETAEETTNIAEEATTTVNSATTVSATQSTDTTTSASQTESTVTTKSTTATVAVTSAETTSSVAVDGDSDSNNTTIWFVVAAIVVVLAGAGAGVAFYIKRKNKA